MMRPDRSDPWDMRFQALELSVATIAAAAHRAELASERVMGAVEALERRLGQRTYSTPPGGTPRVQRMAEQIWWRVSKFAVGALIGGALVAGAGWTVQACTSQVRHDLHP